MASIIKDLFKIKKLTIGLGIFLAIVIMGLMGSIVYPVDPLSTYQMDRPPSQEHLLGTDSRGRDMLAQLLTGIRGSVYVGIIAALIATIIGTIIGAIAGFRGGVTDSTLMLLTDVILTLPTILVLILIAAYFNVRSLLLVALIIGITHWPWLAKAVRAQILSLKSREFIYMSRMAGLGTFKLVVEDLLSNIASYVFMAFVLMMNGAMIAEAGLSMIGVGTTEGITLGTILFWAQALDAIRRGLWWWFIPPGAVLVALTTSLLVIVTALDEFFNPRLRG